MMPSLYSGISGLAAHQDKMGVVGNNVANVNTVGYKSSFVTFKEAAIQTIRSPAASTPGLQVGLGVDLSGITRKFTSGTLTETSQASNMAINGDGFFVVQDDAGVNYVTRAGDFVLDLNATTGQINLITSDGLRLLDTNLNAIDLTPASGADLASYSIDSEGVITVVDVNGVSETKADAIKVQTFQNPNGLKAEGANLYSYTVAAGDPIAAGANVAFAGDVLQGYTESSNVDLATEFTDMILAQRGFQANAKTITTSDEILQTLMSVKS